MFSPRVALDLVACVGKKSEAAGERCLGGWVGRNILVRVTSHERLVAPAHVAGGCGFLFIRFTITTDRRGLITSRTITGESKRRVKRT